MLAGIVLATALLLPRLVRLGSFVTADEPTWGKRAASFYYALREKDFAATNLTGHPGVVTMWAGAAAYAIKFPEYQRVGQLYLGDTKLLLLFQRHGPRPMELMAVARLAVVALVTAALLAAFLLARRLFGLGLALFGFLLIALNPFHIAHSRFLHTNGMLATFMFLSLLGWMHYMRTRKLAGLLVSGTAAGLSFLSISPGLVLIPVIGVITLLGGWGGQLKPLDQELKALLKRAAAPLLLWGGIALLTVYALWPAMWSDPLGTLTQTLSYGFSAAEGEIGGAHFVESYADAEKGSEYLHFYPLTYLWRSTPASLIGAGLALALLLFRRQAIPSEVRRSLYDLLVFVAIYSVVMTLGEKKFDRYYLPVYLPLDLTAAAGWLGAAGWLAGQFKSLQKVYFTLGAAAAVVAVQALSAAQSAPYYLTYYNPLLGGLNQAPQVMSVGWGEGLNDAALYLRQQAGICERKVISWYPLAYSWYSVNFGCPAQLTEFQDGMTLRELQEFDYAVLYINQMQRGFPKETLDYLYTLQPVHSVWIQGVEYVRIYQLRE